MARISLSGMALSRKIRFITVKSTVDACQQGALTHQASSLLNKACFKAINSSTAEGAPCVLALVVARRASVAVQSDILEVN